MANIKAFLTQKFIEKNSLPSNFAYGKAIYDRDGVEFIEQKADIIEAWSGGLGGTIKEGAGSRRRVTFTIKKESLHWNCTGNPKSHQIFCKHCVSVALAIKASKHAG